MNQIKTRDIWTISDTHFSHYNMVHKFKTRPFSTVEEMDEALMDNWNSVVKPGDKVYHLGDVTFGNKENYIKNIHKRLNGKKRLIVGNHDDVKFLAPYFEKVMLWRMFPDWGLLMTHVPVHRSTLGEDRFDGKGMINLHGHIHQNPSPEGPYKCVCVEQPHMNYTPINIEEIKNGSL